jgi:flagellar biosynthesis GTPase FlhF
VAVTREQIFAAADAITAEGKTPTLESIRQHTGGSYSTISPALNEWRAKQKAAPLSTQEPAPAEINERLAAAGAEVWRVALERANARLTEEREALEKTRIALTAERDDALAVADGLVAENEALQAKLAATEASERATKEEVIAQHAKIETQAERIAEQMRENNSSIAKSD